MSLKVYNKIELNYSDYEEFKKENTMDIRKKSDWILFLSLFPFNDVSGKILINAPIKHFGKASFKKIVAEKITKEKINEKMEKNESLDERMMRVADKLINEMV